MSYSPTAQNRPETAKQEEIVRQFVNFSFFKVLPEWRRLPAAEKERGVREFQQAVAKFSDRMLILPYSLLGIRGEADFLLWRVSERLEDFPEMTAELYRTGLGKYLATPYSFLSGTKRSMYIDKHKHPGQESSRSRIVPGQSKYLFIYPFVKTREWYLLPKEKRQQIMDVHIAVGHKYPTVKINTTYSFGFDDQDFVVAFETDHPHDFLDLVMELRETESSKFTVRDTPIFTCVSAELGEILSALS